MKLLHTINDKPKLKKILHEFPSDTISLFFTRINIFIHNLKPAEGDVKLRYQ